MVPADVTARPFPLRGLWSRVVGLTALAFVVWTPMDVAVRSTGDFGATIAVAVAGIALAAFGSHVLLVLPRTSEGRWILVWIAAVLGTVALSIVLNGGILGPPEYTGNFPLRMLIVLSGLAVGHRLGSGGVVSPKWAFLAAASVTLMMSGMMAAAAATGVQADIYEGQGIVAFGTPTGEALEAYLLAFAGSLALLSRRTWVRLPLLLLAIGAVALTFRRGPLVVAVVPLLALLVFDRSRRSGRKWQIDLIVAGVLGVLASLYIGVDFIFLRWIGLFQGETWALSERDVIYPILLAQMIPLDGQTIVGHGLGATVATLGATISREIHAHNDWLELAVNQGLLGLGAFLLLHWVLARGALKSLKVDRRLGVVTVSLYLQFLLTNWTEGLLYAAQDGTMVTLFLGLALGWTAPDRERRAPRGFGGDPVGESGGGGAVQ